MSYTNSNQKEIESDKQILKQKKSSKGAKKFFGISLVIIILGVIIFGAKPLLNSLVNRDFSFLTAQSADKIFSQELFIEPTKNFLKESSEMNFVQENSIIAISAPWSVASRALGSIAEETEITAEGLDTGLTEYIVEEGDTISSIADKFNISLETILWANDLSSKSTIKPGQELMILPISGAVHLVKDGDTIGTIAKKYKGEIDDIVSFNNLTSEADIYVGDMLVIPGGKMPAIPVKVVSTPLAETYFMFPCEGKISQGSHGAFGNAVDIANSCGKPVVASAGGTVQRTGPAPIAGNIVTIMHPNGVVSSYGHLSTITVVPGQVVGTGDIIAYIGNSGYTVGQTGCHLHFEVRGASNFLAQYKIGSIIKW
ncbi:MAG: LysM peptidoglycan-binding domain-containing protein [Candidatus Nealsonbacteria bacterium]